MCSSGQLNYNTFFSKENKECLWKRFRLFWLVGFSYASGADNEVKPEGNHRAEGEKSRSDVLADHVVDWQDALEVMGEVVGVSDGKVDDENGKANGRSEAKSDDADG